MRNRQKQRELRKEESLSTRNSAGYRDLTAFKAVEKLRCSESQRSCMTPTPLIDAKGMG